MKKILFLMMIVITFIGCSKDNEEPPKTPQEPENPPIEEKYDVTVDLKMAGTLASNVPNKQFRTLKINGNLNGSDIKYLRGIIEGLTEVNLLDANIVEGGDSYYNITNKTKNNVIGKYMFTGLKGNFKLILPKHITEIEEEAFESCSGLSEIDMSDYIQTIGSSAFQNCTKLHNVTLPNSITTIASRIFLGCTNLRTITFPQNLKTLSNNAFYQCSGLVSIKLPDSLTEINAGAFQNCYSLKEILIPDNVTLIGRRAFSDCQNLEIVYLGKSISKLEEEGFKYCDKLKEVHCYALTPPTINAANSLSACFSDGIEKLYIPKGTLNAYKTTFWKRFFKEIIEE